MNPLRILGIFALSLLFCSCGKKSKSAEKEIREAGYEMTTEGWFNAVEAGDITVLRKMVSAGFDEKTRNSAGDNALNVAAAKGSKSVGEYLLNRGFSIDETGADGNTPLMSSVLSDQSSMVSWLLSQGADPKIKNTDGFTALMLATTNGKASSVEELAPYHREELDDALLVAALLGKSEIIDTLTNYGASVYARMEDGRTPLMLAAENGNKETVALLMDIGASRFATTEDGQTAQSFAVSAGHDEIAKMIETGFTGETLALESDDQVAAAMEEHVEDIDFSDTETVLESTNNGKPLTQIAPQPLAGAKIAANSAPIDSTNTGQTLLADEPALIMRHYRQRELPVQVKQVSGGVASLRLAGENSREVQVSKGEIIPSSTLMVVKVYSRTEMGKLNNNQPTEVGIVEVEDTVSGQRAEWLEGRSAPGHAPVALVEDAITGQRYVAKPGQTFTSEDGREFVVSDVRPSQLVIEETATGRVSTLRLRGPKG